MEDLECRPGCAACCVAISISSPLPGLPAGKPAGLPCPFLDESLRCSLYGRPERPAVCASLKPLSEMCGSSREEAMAYLAELERLTAPEAPSVQASGAGPEATVEEPGD